MRNDRSKVRHANDPNPLLYSSVNPFIIGNTRPSNPQAGIAQNEYPYTREKPEPNKPKFKVVFIIRGKKHELINEKKKERWMELQRRKKWESETK